MSLLGHFGLVQTVAPTEEPISLSEAKAFLYGPLASDDVIVKDCIAEARDRCERVTGLTLITQTWVLRLDHFPYDGVIQIPKFPLQSVSSVAYTDENGTSQTWATSDYQVDIYSRPGRIIPAYDEDFPQLRGTMNDVVITFVAGFGLAAAVPAEIKGQLRNCVKYLFDNRDMRDDDYLEKIFSGSWAGSYY